MADVRLGCKAAQVNLATSIGDQVVTDVGFKPKILIVTHTSPSIATGVGAHAHAGIAFAAAVDDGSETQFGLAQMSEDANASVTNPETRSALHVVNGMDKDGALVDQAALKTFDTDGFTLDVTTAGGGGGPIQYLAIGGNEITNVHLEELTSSTSVQSVNYTNCGFAPDCLIFSMSYDGSAAPNNGSEFMLGLGWATSASDQIAMCAGIDQTEVTKVSRRQQDGLCIQGLKNDNHSLVSQAAVSAILANGYTLNWSASHGIAVKFYALAIKGGAFKTQTFTSPATAIQESKTNFGFRPVGGMALNMSNASSSILLGGVFNSIGVMSGSTGVSLGAVHLDNTDPTEADSIIQSDEFLNMANNGGTSWEEASVDSLDSDGYTQTWGQAAAAAVEYGVLLMGEQVSGSRSSDTMLLLGVG